jgi:transcriptional regulator with XRE-family HTH domain
VTRQQQQVLLILGQAVRELRMERQRSVRDLATLCGMSLEGLAALEDGRLDPDPEMLDALALALEVRRPEIFLRAQQIAARDSGGEPGEQAR